MHPQVIPPARSDSFPSSIWLMGAGEREQGAAWPPRGPPRSPIHAALQLLPVPGSKRDEMRTFPDQLHPQTGQTHPSRLSLGIFAKGRMDVTFLSAYCALSAASTLTPSSHPLSESAEYVHPTRLPAGDPSSPPFSPLKLGIKEHPPQRLL